MENQTDTKITQASVKVMRSLDYNNFEVNLTIENDQGINLQEIDEKRKQCQRLVDKAVTQFIIADTFARTRKDTDREIKRLESRIKGLNLMREKGDKINMDDYKHTLDALYENQLKRSHLDYDYEDEANELPF